MLEHFLSETSDCQPNEQIRKDGHRQRYHCRTERLFNPHRNRAERARKSSSGVAMRSFNPRNRSENPRFGAEVSARDGMIFCAPRIHHPATNTALKSGLAFRQINRAQKVERATKKR
jgi:hypothetical protein